MRLFPHAGRVKAQLLQQFAGKRILDIGCGASKTPGAVGLDRRWRAGVPKESQMDVACELEKLPWPLKDNSFDLVIFSHVLEHLTDVVGPLEEINRVTKPGGQVFIEVPHFTWVEAFRHFEHKHFFTMGSFDYFVKGNPHYRTDFKILKRYLFFDDFTNCIGMGFLANRFIRFYEKHLAYIFPGTSFYVLLEVDK
jgi:ubiquinone/menaquinone biosynthesis C-methylase UbiE